MNKNKITCEKCVYYDFIDSGYGYCKRYPPKLIAIKMSFLGIKYKTNYPIIAWYTKICGEFENHLKNKFRRL